jgi:hypothetical protein
MQSALHVLSQAIRDFSPRSENASKSFSRFFAAGMDVMRIATLNQIIGMLTADLDEPQAFNHPDIGTGPKRCRP